MRNIVKLSVIFLFLSVGTFLVMTSNAQAKRSELTESFASPRSLYLQNCARCHGANGKAQTKLGKSVEADDLTSRDVKKTSTGRIARTIARGRGDMPAFAKKLSPKQIASIASYVRSL